MTQTFVLCVYDLASSYVSVCLRTSGLLCQGEKGDPGPVGPAGMSGEAAVMPKGYFDPKGPSPLLTGVKVQSKQHWREEILCILIETTSIHILLLHIY